MCGGIHAEDEPDFDPKLEQLEMEEEEASHRKFKDWLVHLTESHFLGYLLWTFY